MAYIGGKQTRQKWKVWVLKIFFQPPCAVKAQKLTDVGLFKVESVLSKSLKITKKELNFLNLRWNLLFLFLFDTDVTLNKLTAVKFWACTAHGG